MQGKLSTHSASKQGWQDLPRAAKHVSMSLHEGTVTINLLGVASDVTKRDVTNEWPTQPEKFSKIYLSALILTLCGRWYACVVGICRDVQAMRLCVLDDKSCCDGL